VSQAETIEAYHSVADLAASQLDHPSWTNAQVVKISSYWSGESAPLGRHAEARLIWTNEAICVRYVCNQTEPLVVNSTPQTNNKTVGLWDRDVCEIFLAPCERAPERYFEFEAAPTGEWIDLAVCTMPDKRETDWEFHSGMTAAARVEEDRVVIAMRIPWNGWSHKPRKGKRWRVNLFRCVGSGATRGYLAWQPTHTQQPNFHVPEVFGWLLFS
jgi:alpha-galactosidase